MRSVMPNAVSSGQRTDRRRPGRRPKVLIVGGSDVDARLELMQGLSQSVDVEAAGSTPALRSVVLDRGFGYHAYRLNRTVNPVQDLVTLIDLILLFRRTRPDIVHAFDTKPGVWGCIAARWTGVPVVIGTVTGLGSLYADERPTTRLLRAAFEPLQRAACTRSDLTVFQNRDDARRFVAAGIVTGEKAVVIPGSGVRTDTFDPARVSPDARDRVRRPLGIRPGQIVVVMVARVLRSKGVMDFAAAAEQLRTRHPRARFVLVGGEDHESLDRLTAPERARLRAAVIWPGARRDIPAVLASADIFVLPSAYPEGVPRALLEAASMGLPLVTTDSPGCNDVVEDGLNGFLVPLHDTAALSAAIGRLIEEPDLRLGFGREARRRAVERFDLSVVVSQTLGVYRQMLTDKQSRSLAAAGVVEE